MSAAPATDVIDWDLTVDELRTVREHLPGLVLPSFLPDGAPDTPAAVSALVDLGLLTRAPEADEASWAEALDTSFLMALGLQNAASMVIQIHAWQPGENIGHATAIEASAASHITMRAGDGLGTARARVRGSVIDQAWPTIVEVLPVLQVESPVHGSVTVSTVASQALVDAIAQGDPALLAAVVAELHVPVDAVDLFSGLAEPVRYGFRVKAFTAERGPVFMADWFGTSRGWIRMSIGLEPEARGATVTPELLTDAGRVTVTAQTADDIRTDLLGLVAGLIKERDV